VNPRGHIEAQGTGSTENLKTAPGIEPATFRCLYKFTLVFGLCNFPTFAVLYTILTDISGSNSGIVTSNNYDRLLSKLSLLIHNIFRVLFGAT
jgi:hypothetical protein